MFPIIPIEREFTFQQEKIIIKNFPIVPAFARTAHGVQGRTLDNIVVADPTPSTMKKVENSTLYVIFSRCRTRNGVYLLTPLTEDHFQHFQPEKYILNELERIESLAIETERNYKINNDLGLIISRSRHCRSIVKRKLDSVSAQVNVSHKQLCTISCNNLNNSENNISPNDVHVIGLRNEGNTCYMNALLQALLPLQTYINFVTAMAQAATLQQTIPQQIASSLSSFFNLMTQDRTNLTTIAIRQALTNIQHDYSILTQKDVTETFTYLTQYHTAFFSQPCPFAFTFEKTMACTNCHFNFNTQTSFGTILPLPISTSIELSIDKHTQPEIIKDANCHNCNYSCLNTTSKFT